MGLLEVGFDVIRSRVTKRTRSSEADRALEGKLHSFARNHAPEIVAADLFVAATMGLPSIHGCACRLLGLAMFGHAGPIGIAPLVGEAAAGVQGGRAGRADVAAGSLGVAGRSQRGHREPQGKHSQRFLPDGHD